MKQYVSILLLAGMLAISSLSNAQYKQNLSNPTQLIYNPGSLLPLKKLDDYKIAVISALPQKYKAFIDQAQQYADVTSFDFSDYYEQTKYYNTLIVVGASADLRSDLLAMVNQSQANHKKVILCEFLDATKVSSADFAPAKNAGIATLQASELSEKTQQQLAMSIFGGMAITEGKYKTQQTRIQFSQGEGSGLNLRKMTTQIDAIAAEAIREKATPGMVVMAVKDGQVIFDKAYGTHTYAQTEATKVNDIFDLASISKIAGTTPVIMNLHDEQKITLDSTIGHYLGQTRTTNKKDISLRTVLLHEAGFTPFIPFYKYLKAGDLQSFKDDAHQVQVADHAFLKSNYYKEVMWPAMLTSTLKPQGNYVYSDISMYVMKEVAEQVTSTAMEDYVQDLLYRPIGMKTAGYNPLTRFPKSRIVPTENDTSFRKELLQGYVHDQGAAMAGGVAGHAGLFGSANDLAIYGQLLLNRGEYGGMRYFQASTVDLFTSKQGKNSRRGLGFDRFDPDLKSEYPAKLANSSVFGHTGYTGTCIWIDPKNQLIFIFLSNRVHPQVSPQLSNLGIRSRIFDAIYETINHAK